MAAGPPPPELAIWAYNLGFSLDALALNRRGLVSPDQLRGLLSNAVVDAILPLLYLGCGAIVAFGLKPRWRWLFVAGMVALSTFSFMKVVHRIQDRLHPEAVAVEGKVTIYAGARNSISLFIGSKSFTMAARTRGQRVVDLIDPKTTYRLYYLRHTELPLSMEPVATDGKPR